MTDCLDDDIATSIDSIMALEAGGPPPNAGKGNRPPVLRNQLRYDRRAAKRRYLTQLNVSNAAKALDRLPVDGETFHMIMSGNFDLDDIIPAIVRLAGPANMVCELNIATLGTNTRTTENILSLMKDGHVDRVSFLCSEYFKSMSDSGQIYAHLHRELGKRGQRRVAACRCHAKLILFEFASGMCIVCEGSANLRSCRSLEQLCITYDRGLLEFHRRWMQEIFENA